MPTYRIDLGYDGTDFRGFARQAGQRTVQGVLEDGIGRVLGSEVRTTGAGRTDAGVHARQQVVSFQWEDPVDTVRLWRSLNAMLASEVVVLAVEEVGPDFNARFSAKWRRYRYRVLNAVLPDPLRRRFCWHVAHPLAIEPMHRASQSLVGEHDFAAFCRAPPAGTTVRRVLDAGWGLELDLAVFTITATSFCHQMVRSMVGFLVDVGRGRRTPEDAAVVLAGRDRSGAGQLAPPLGLMLWQVGYEDL
jgi:tRNA pseudouridine38-40 synthase